MLSDLTECLTLKNQNGMEEKFYFCNTCGNLLLTAIASGVIPYCCGEKMTLLKPNTHEGATEKHLPQITHVSPGIIKVCIGSEPHPMTEIHNIRFISLETTNGFLIRYLEPGSPAEAEFHFEGRPLSAYAYCNIHGLWQTMIPT